MELSNYLKYDRSLYPGKAVFFYKIAGNDFVPLEADVNRIRGQKTSFAEAFTSKFEPKNLAPQDLAYSNPIVIEECYVPPHVEHIYCRFSLRVQACSIKPSGCGNTEVFATLKALAEEFKACGGYKELAIRYCKNILLGTWLWRNQNTGDTSIEVKSSSGKIYTIENTRLLSWESTWPDAAVLALEQLSEEVHQALTNPSVFWCADITAKIATAFCQEIYPSQVFGEKGAQGEASKQFVKTKCIDGRHAVSFNSVKIGAALQSIDDWYLQDAKRLRVHEYGADRDSGIALRQHDSDLNFYSLFIKADCFLDELRQQRNSKQIKISSQIYYVFSVLIKGGMFQKKAESKTKE